MSERLPDRPRATLKTYSHLAGAKRMPTDYEIATSRLLPYVERGQFETELPLGAWYAKWQRGSRFQASDWERFADPRETTYTKYVSGARDREAHVDALFASMDDESTPPLPAAWTATVGRALFPLRFALHGLQMVGAYVGSMAPSGRVAVASAMQCADEMRRIQRIAYRMAVARKTDANVEAATRAAWQTGEAWQPLRETIERLLVTWDWGEAFVAHALVVKPAFDALVNVAFARRARANGDAMLAETFRSFAEDAAWHADWARALVAVADGQESAAAVAEWTGAWSPRVDRAVAALAPLFDVHAHEHAEASS